VRKASRHGEENAVEATVAEVYVSADIEADGPIPGLYSMLSFGLAVAGEFDGKRFARSNPSEQSFYRELHPISDRFDPSALAVSHLDREALRRDGSDPATAMSEASEWVRAISADRQPVLVAYPLGFDWMFLYWYFVRFAKGGSPFGFSDAIDIKTMYATKAHELVSKVSKSEMPTSLLPSHEHTHHARDDAIEQAELFANIFEWVPESPSR
jgi:hypothetical protein